MYHEGEVVQDYPLHIKYQGEKAIDYGGVQRDLFSAFWSDTYSRLFEGAKTLIPMVPPSMALSVYPIIGRIISHGYIPCSFLPVSIALPSLISMVLGPTVVIPSDILSSVSQMMLVIWSDKF